jgi:hypothetical protein
LEESGASVVKVELRIDKRKLETRILSSSYSPSRLRSERSMESLMMVMMGAEGVQIKWRGGVVYRHLQPPSGSEQAPTPPIGAYASLVPSIYSFQHNDMSIKYALQSIYTHNMIYQRFIKPFSTR